MESSIFRYIESSIVDLKFDILSKVRYSIEGSIFYRKFDIPSKVRYSIESSIFHRKFNILSKVRYFDTSKLSVRYPTLNAAYLNAAYMCKMGPFSWFRLVFFLGTHIYIYVYI